MLESLVESEKSFIADFVKGVSEIELVKKVVYSSKELYVILGDENYLDNFDLMFQLMNIELNLRDKYELSDSELDVINTSKSYDGLVLYNSKKIKN